jgi:hypothetical protein
MATINATPSVKTAFEDGDTVICDFSPAARNGVQVEAQGFTLDDAVVTARGISSTTYDAIAVADPIANAVIGGDPRSIVGSVTVSGVTGGTKFVTFNRV